ncbi:MAG: RNA 2',3'-cyclic phosphodiesterase [Armatimonadota bacterium]
MDTIRTFIAIQLEDTQKTAIKTICSQLQNQAPDVRWIKPANMHITLKFLGPLKSEEVSKVCDITNDVAKSFRPFNISFKDIGCFPNPTRPRVVWIGVDKGKQELETLVKFLERKLEKEGFPKESNIFKAHITIGRIKDKRKSDNLTHICTEYEMPRLENLDVDKIYVMKSDLKPTGPVYTSLGVCSLSE